jgi:hypothetical protein
MEERDRGRRGRLPEPLHRIGARAKPREESVPGRGTRLSAREQWPGAGQRIVEEWAGAARPATARPVTGYGGGGRVR